MSASDLDCFGLFVLRLLIFARETTEAVRLQQERHHKGSGTFKAGPNLQGREHRNNVEPLCNEMDEPQITRPLSMMVAVATSSIPLHYVAQAWRGAAILSFVWFLHRWKANVLGRVVAAQNLAGIDRDKFSSVGLFVIGLMPLAGRSIGFLSWRKNVHCRTSARKLVIQLVDLPVNL
ncbi:hypothetical protein V6N13_061049 [Hibiscus sabdariffa]